MRGRTGRPARTVAALAIAALPGAGLAAGCGGGDDDAADAPTTTEATTQAPPATEAPPVTDAPDEPAAAGDVAAGKQAVESGDCAGCHPGAGTSEGVGPVLAGAGLSTEQIETTIVEGRGVMPGGLVSGDELADVVAYVESLQ